jgi:hypothetical protein
MSSPRRVVLKGLGVKRIHGGGLSSGILSEGVAVVRNGHESDSTKRPLAGGPVLQLLAQRNIGLVNLLPISHMLTVFDKTE